MSPQSVSESLLIHLTPLTKTENSVLHCVRARLRCGAQRGGTRTECRTTFPDERLRVPLSCCNVLTFFIHTPFAKINVLLQLLIRLTGALKYCQYIAVKTATVSGRGI